MSDDLKVTITATGAQELTKLFESLEKVSAAAGKLAGSGKALEELRRIMVGVGSSGSSLGQLEKSIRELSQQVGNLPTQMSAALRGISDTGEKAGKALGQSFEKGARASLTQARSAVRQEVAALQAEYEAATAKGWNFKPAALQKLKLQGVTLFPSDRELLDLVKKEEARLQAALSGLESSSAIATAAATDARKVSLARGKARLQAFTEVTAAANAQLLTEAKSEEARLQASLKALDEASSISAADASSIRRISLARGKARLAAFVETTQAANAQLLTEAKSEEARLQASLKALDEASSISAADASSIRRISLARGKARLQAFTEVTAAANAQLLTEAKSEEARLQASLKALDEASSISAADASSIRRISLARGKARLAAFIETTQAANAQLLTEAKSEEARLQASLKLLDERSAEQSADAAAIRRISLARGKARIQAFKEVTAAANAQIIADEKEAAAQLTARLKAIETSSLAAAKAAANAGSRSGALNLTPTGQYSDLKSGLVVDPSKVKAGTDALKGQGDALRKFAADANTAHSAARGLASGFGLLWLTWGNLLPLFAGAAVSNGLVQLVKQGAAVEQTLEIVRVLGEESASSVNKLRDELLQLSRSGPQGPKEIAEAIKILSLAGLQANEILLVTKDVLNFSVAGTVSIEKAADALVSISTAFGLGAEGFGRIGDVISKTAAISKSSVESISASFKVASVINAQYGVTLEDVATGLAALSQLGIQGTAAGTALRNMYADLSGRSAAVAKVLKSQNIELRDSTGAFRDLVTVVGEVRNKLVQLDGISQKNFLQALTSERGAKPLVELLRQIEQAPKTAQAAFSNMLEANRHAIQESYGFQAEAAIQLAQTTENKFKAMSSSLSAALVEAFGQAQPALQLFADAILKIIRDKSFVEWLSTAASNAAAFAQALAENIRVITIAISLWAASRVLMGLLGAASQLAAAGARAHTAAVVGNTEAQVANAAANTAANAATAGASTVLSTAATWLSRLNVVLGVATAAWILYDFWKSKGNQTARADQANVDNTLEAVKRETARVEAQNEILAKGGSFADANRQVDNQEKFATAVVAAQTKVQAAFRDEIQAEEALAKARERAAFLGGVDSQRAVDSKLKAYNATHQIRLATERDAAAETSAIRNESAKLEAAYKRQAELVDARKPKGTPTGDGKFSNSPAVRAQSFTKDLLSEENDLHRKIMQELQQSATAEKQIIDAKHRAQLISESEYQVQALAITENGEQARLYEIDRHATVARDKLLEAMRAVRTDAASEGISNIKDSTELQGAAFERLSSKAKSLIEQYKHLQTQLVLVNQTTDDELIKLAQEVNLRQTLLSIEFEGNIAKEVKAYRDLNRELDVNLEKQKDKLALEDRLATMSDIERAGAQAKLAYEEQSSQQIAKRSEELQKWIGLQQQLGVALGLAVMDGNVAAIGELTNRYGDAAAAVAMFSKSLEEMKAKASQGGAMAQLAAEAAQARKEVDVLRDDLSKRLLDAIMKGSAGFKAFWTGLRDWLKDLFGKMLLKVAIQPLVGGFLGSSGIASAATGGAFAYGGGSSTGSALGTASNVASLAGVAGSAASFGTAAGYGASALFSGTGGTALASGGSMVAAGSFAEGLGMIAGVLGPIAIALVLIIAALKKVPSTGSYAGGTFGANGQFTQTEQMLINFGNNTDKQNSKVMKDAATTFTTQLSEAARSFGGEVLNGLQVFVGTDTDRTGKSSGTIQYLRGGEVVGGIQTGGGFGKQAASKIDTNDISQWFQDNAPIAIVQGLQQSDLPAKFKDYFSSIASDDLTADTAKNLLATAQAVQAFDKAVKPLGGSLSGLADLGVQATVDLASMVGGLDNLTNVLNTYYQTFYSDSERHTTALNNLTQAYGALNLGALPQTKEQFRSVIDTFVSGGGLMQEDGQKTYLTLLQLANTFANLQGTSQDLSKKYDLEIAIMQAQGDVVGALAKQREIELAALQASNPELITLQKTLYGLQDAAAAAAQLEEVKSNLDGIISKFRGGPELYNYKASRINDQLGATGFSFSAEQILGASKADIEALWNAVGPEGKIAIEKAYGAWQDLMTLVQQDKINTFLSDLGVTGDELLGAYDKINPKAKDLVQTWEDTSTKLDDLKNGLNGLLGIETETPLTRLKATLTQRDALSGVIGTNSDSIYSLRANQATPEGAAYLKNLEANLWASYKASNGDPKIAQELTKVTIDRIRLEAKIKDAAWASGSDPTQAALKKKYQAEADALQAQIDGYKKLKDMAKDLQNYVLDLKRGDLSDQSYAGRLGTARGMFESSVSDAAKGDSFALSNVQGNASEYLKQAQQFYGGSTLEYSQIFQAVTSSLEGLSGLGAGVDPQIAAAQEQLDATNKLLNATTDTSQAEIDALMTLNSAFGVDLTTLQTSADDQVAAVKASIAKMEEQKELLEAQITQAGAAYKAMLEVLDKMSADIKAIRNTGEVAEASKP